MITVSKTILEGVLLIEPGIFEDFRGHQHETYNRKLYAEAGIDIDFVQDNISVSSKHVLRGIHGDDDTWKLVSCPLGKIYLVVVDIDAESSDFKKWQHFTLSAQNRHQVLIPPKYGNAHLVMSDTAIFHYKLSAYYNPQGQFTYRWDDPQFNIWWPVKHPILSPRDDFGKIVE